MQPRDRLAVVRLVVVIGLKLPLVIGVGNVHYSDLLRVPLSTIDQSSTSIGQQAADILVKAIGNKRKRPIKTVLIDPILMARESTR